MNSDKTKPANNRFFQNQNQHGYVNQEKIVNNIIRIANDGLKHVNIYGKRKKHPNQLKVIVWNTKDQPIHEMRKTLEIHDSFCIRQRGVNKLRRLKVWCRTRAKASTYARS